MSARDERTLPYYPGSPLRERVYAGTGERPIHRPEGSGARFFRVVCVADGLAQARL
jgi:hypothetical protein